MRAVFPEAAQEARREDDDGVRIREPVLVREKTQGQRVRFPFRATRGRAPWAVGALWGDQRCEAPGLRGRYRNVLTGESVTVQGTLALSEAFQHLPFAVLVRA